MECPLLSCLRTRSSLRMPILKIRDPQSRIKKRKNKFRNWKVPENSSNSYKLYLVNWPKVTKSMLIQQVFSDRWPTTMETRSKSDQRGTSVSSMTLCYPECKRVSITRNYTQIWSKSRLKRNKLQTKRLRYPLWFKKMPRWKESTHQLCTRIAPFLTRNRIRLLKTSRPRTQKWRKREVLETLNRWRRVTLSSKNKMSSPETLRVESDKSWNTRDQMAQRKSRRL